MEYVDIAYCESEKPITAYPDCLIGYLCERFNLHPENSVSANVLDVGCGRGDFTNAFYRLGLDCYAVDNGNRPSRLLDKIVFNNANLETGKLPFEDEYFDVVFAKSVIEHIVNYDNLITECKRVMKPKGTLIVMTPDWVSCHRIFYDAYSHIHPYTEKSLKKLLLIHDMNVITCERFVQFPAVWRNLLLRTLCRFLQCLGPVRKERKSSFFRWSRELILLAVARKH